MNLTLTNNFYTWLRSVLFCVYPPTIGSTTTSTEGFYNGIKPIERMTDMNNEGQETLHIDSYQCRCHASLNYWNSGLELGTFFRIGNNNTPASESDCVLGGDYVQGTQYTMSHKAIKNATMVNGKAQLDFSVTFTAIEDITIGEIGLCKKIPKSSSTSVAQPTYLFGRVALDTPIELSAGESATFQITIAI